MKDLNNSDRIILTIICKSYYQVFWICSNQACANQFTSCLTSLPCHQEYC